MGSAFVAVVSKTGDSTLVQSTVSLYQKNGNSLTHVAYLYDSSAPCDHRRTKIQFAEGTLHFLAAYDGPVKDHFVWDFLDPQGRETGISLHRFPRGKQSYLCTPQGFFPIAAEYNKDSFELRVYKPTYVLQAGGMLHPLLATLRQTKKDARGFEYSIQVNETVPVPTLMAIFSLPFTLLSIY